MVTNSVHSESMYVSGVHCSILLEAHTADSATRNMYASMKNDGMYTAAVRECGWCSSTARSWKGTERWTLVKPAMKRPGAWPMAEWWKRKRPSVYARRKVANTNTRYTFTSETTRSTPGNGWIAHTAHSRSMDGNWGSEWRVR